MDALQVAVFILFMPPFFPGALRAERLPADVPQLLQVLLGRQGHEEALVGLHAPEELQVPLLRARLPLQERRGQPRADPHRGAALRLPGARLRQDLQAEERADAARAGGAPGLQPQVRPVREGAHVEVGICYLLFSCW